MLNISITQPELQQIVEERVRNGEYASPSEVVAAALLLLDDDRRLPPAELEELRGQVLRGAQQADRGEFVEFTADDIIREETKAMKARQKSKGE